ncbi:recombination protein RecR [Mycoplasma sp. Pen4]|uniref:toprim domain-containing protein n=1 Tax=Mycoplasma sp. Pen4 TaxID=640330 RepID=UPI0016543341|nr:toprim domain-containing protein [Mycoplasma sp. Pen4]QNM93627.1 recombination protein RecR [Mycoplasma sp. Pen4]
MLDNKNILEFVVKAKQIPGISKKQAEKIVYWILATEEDTVNDFANSIKKIKEHTDFCSICTNITYKGVCNVCSDLERENTLLIVESLQNLQKIEKAGFYKGKYYVFPHLVENITDIKKHSQEFDKLLNYSKTFDEVILGISPTLKGEITNEIIKKELQSCNVKVSQLAIGLPLGSSVDYIDEITLRFALKNRQN